MLVANWKMNGSETMNNNWIEGIKSVPKNIQSKCIFCPPSCFLYQASNPEIQICNSDTGVTVNDGVILQQGGLNFYMWNQEAGDIRFGTSNEEKMKDQIEFLFFFTD